MRRVVLALAAVTCVCGLAWLGLAVAGDPPPAAPAYPNPTIAAAVAAGRHVRIDGPHGTVHVWIPAGYHADTGATILYVHGYFDDADTAWIGHQLPEQFALSGANAIFIAPEAPVAPKIPVNYPDLGELLRLVEDRAGVIRGAATTIAMGHSGAYRTLEAWLDEPTLDMLVMVDASYGEEDTIVTWLRASPKRRLITVGEDTVLATESLAGKLAADTYIMDRVPPTYDLWPAEARTARHLYVRAQYPHMPLVTEGVVLPSLLKLLPVDRLPNLPWKLPIGSLPPLPDAAVDGTSD